MSTNENARRAEKTRENRLRRLAGKYDLRLVKSRSRNPDAYDFGLYALMTRDRNLPVNPGLLNRWTCSWDLDTVEEYLTNTEY